VLGGPLRGRTIRIRRCAEGFGQLAVALTPRLLLSKQRNRTTYRSSGMELGG